MLLFIRHIAYIDVFGSCASHANYPNYG